MLLIVRILNSVDADRRAAALDPAEIREAVARIMLIEAVAIGWLQERVESRAACADPDSTAREIISNRGDQGIRICALDREPLSIWVDDREGVCICERLRK